MMQNKKLKEDLYLILNCEFWLKSFSCFNICDLKLIYLKYIWRNYYVVFSDLILNNVNYETQSIFSVVSNDFFLRILNIKHILYYLKVYKYWVLSNYTYFYDIMMKNKFFLNEILDLKLQLKELFKFLKIKNLNNYKLKVKNTKKYFMSKIPKIVKNHSVYKLQSKYSVVRKFGSKNIFGLIQPFRTQFFNFFKKMWWLHRSKYFFRLIPRWTKRYRRHCNFEKYYKNYLIQSIIKKKFKYVVNEYNLKGNHLYGNLIVFLKKKNLFLTLLDFNGWTLQHANLGSFGFKRRFKFTSRSISIVCRKFKEKIPKLIYRSYFYSVRLSKWPFYKYILWKTLKFWHLQVKKTFNFVYLSFFNWYWYYTWLFFFFNKFKRHQISNIYHLTSLDLYLKKIKNKINLFYFFYFFFIKKYFLSFQDYFVHNKLYINVEIRSSYSRWYAKYISRALFRKSRRKRLPILWIVKKLRSIWFVLSRYRKVCYLKYKEAVIFFKTRFKFEKFFNKKKEVRIKKKKNRLYNRRKKEQIRFLEHLRFLKSFLYNLKNNSELYKGNVKYVSNILRFLKKFKFKAWYWIKRLHRYRKKYFPITCFIGTVEYMRYLSHSKGYRPRKKRRL